MKWILCCVLVFGWLSKDDYIHIKERRKGRDETERNFKNQIGIFEILMVGMVKIYFIALSFLWNK